VAPVGSTPPRLVLHVVHRFAVGGLDFAGFKGALMSTMRTMGTSLGKEILRGVLGGILGNKKR
jgi:hypothetical protein